MIAEKGFFFVVGPVLASNIRIRCKVIGSCLADIKRLKALMRSRDTGGRRRPPERKNLPERTAPLSFGSAIKSGSLPSNPDELVAIGVTKISEISAIWAHARRILD